MVYFTCSQCGDSLQKPRVEKHYQTVCRKPISVTCVDCLKDFDAYSYVEHTRCVTEDERYAAKDFQLKPNANKGLKKQEKWVETIQDILKKNPNIPPEQRILLNNISKHPNVPRKLNKFQNFIKNISPKSKPNVVKAVFELLDKEHKSSILKQNSASQNQNKPTTIPTTPIVSQNGSVKKENGVSKKTNKDKFKWKPTILYYVNKKTNIKNKKLMKSVLQAYKSYHPELKEIPDEIIQKYHVKLAKMKKVFVENDLVKLRQ